MKELLIAVVAISFALCCGNPLRYETSFTDNQRDTNFQLTPYGDAKPLTQKQYSIPRSKSQGNRQEYRRFGVDALFQDTTREFSTFNPIYKADNVATFLNQNPQVIRERVSQNNIEFPTSTSNQDGQIQKSNFNRDNSRIDSTQADNPLHRVQTLPSQANRRPYFKDEDHAPISAVHSQVEQNDAPRTVHHLPQDPVIVHSKNKYLGAKFSSAQGQFSQTRQNGHQNRNSLRINPKSQDQQSQNSEFSNQNIQHANNQDKLGRIPSISEQNKASVIPEEYVKQQHQNQLSYAPNFPSSKDVPLRQMQNKFESRIPFVKHEERNENLAEKPNTYVSTPTHIGSNLQEENQQTRYGGITRISANAHSKDVLQTRDQVQNGARIRFQDAPQGRYQDLGKGQAVMMALPQFTQDHTTPILFSGPKDFPAVVYKTGSIAVPHAAVISKDSSGIVSKASLSYHLRTPFTHYTYSHRL